MYLPSPGSVKTSAHTGLSQNGYRTKLQPHGLTLEANGLSQK